MACRNCVDIAKAEYKACYLFMVMDIENDVLGVNERYLIQFCNGQAIHARQHQAKTRVFLQGPGQSPSYQVLVPFAFAAPRIQNKPNRSCWQCLLFSPHLLPLP